MNAQQAFPFIALFVAMICAGCDSLHYSQYVVANASASDRGIIKRAIESSAIAAGLVDKTETSRIPGTIAYYREPLQKFPVVLGARMIGDSGIVDLSCFHPGVSKPPAFKTAESALTESLTREFGDRLTMPDYLHRVPLTQ